MRALRVVGITEDGGEVCVVLEDPARRERYSVPADERLRAAARGDVTRLGQIAIELESQLRPREIQARIRAGESVEQVAAAAGATQEKIERFAYPVLLERSRTAELARRAHPVRAEGPDARTLEEVVAHTFGMRGQEYEKADWDSWKGEDGRWVAALSWRAGRSDNSAHWTYQPGAHGGTVTALDENASDLVEGLPARPLRTVGPVIDMSRSEDGAAPSPQPAEPLRAAAGSDTLRADLSRDRAASRPGTPEPRRPTPPEQLDPARERPADPDPAPADTPADAQPPAEPAADAPAEPSPAPVKRTRKGKPVMPSWDEVLLGVRGQR
ncbi:MAG TPA: septation protein SepH [Pseudonocardia sp.]|nr:septation protein SepH [Pseudonocardia sp.]